MSRETEERIGDMIEAIDRCRRYIGALDSDATADLADMAEDAIEIGRAHV